MRGPHAAAVVVRWGLVLALGALSSCGGGSSPGSSNGSPTSADKPIIVASILTFPSNEVPAGFIPSGYNTVADVAITDQTSGTSITSAVVSVNGTALSYVPSDQQYEGALNVSPSVLVAINVMVNGVAYTAAHTNISTYPTITAPAYGTTWSASVSNLTSWSGALPDSTSSYALGVTDTIGSLVWPAGGSLADVQTSTSDVIDAKSLTAGNRLVLVGIVDVLTFPGAAGGSGVLIGGFTYTPITVTATVATVQSVTTAPATVTVGAGKSAQLSATGAFSDGSTQDITTQVIWNSSDTTKVTVTGYGTVTGVARGAATVTATYGGASGSTTVSVFQPNPSPMPPLSQSVAFQIDYAHSGFATVGGSGPVFPPTATWSTTLNGPVSYPIIADGRVIVTTGVNASDPAAYGTSLYALNLATGAIEWGPITILGTYSFSAAAYDHGTLFVNNFDGVVSALDPATGATLWTTKPPFAIYTTTPPMAVNGVLYLGGLGALDELTGNVLWTANIGSGKNSPTVSSDGVFVALECDVYKLDPLSGTPLWHYSAGCEGGGATTAPYANKKLYTSQYTTPPQSQVFNADTGAPLGPFTASTFPAFSPQAGFFSSKDPNTSVSTLTALSETDSSTLWTFQGDGKLITPPIVIDGVAVIGSSSGTVYALNASTGNVVWSGNAGPQINGADPRNANQLTGLGAGEGWLIVPAGNTVVGWKVVP